MSVIDILFSSLQEKHPNREDLKLNLTQFLQEEIQEEELAPEVLEVINELASNPEIVKEVEQVI